MTVYLVGAGPGDPGLITARGLDLIRSCDVLVHDRLVAPELVDEAPHHARVISRDGLDQQALNELLVGYGRAGFDVVRLKGGDPFVFGRGGEEALALREAGIETEVVPGVSSIAAVPAAAGIPVTHRGVSDRVTIASCQGADGSEAEYARLAAIGGTLILFMGLGRVERVVDGPPRGRTAAGHARRRDLARDAPRPGGREDDARAPRVRDAPGLRARRCWSSATSPRSSFSHRAESCRARSITSPDASPVTYPRARPS